MRGHEIVFKNSFVRALGPMILVAFFSIAMTFTSVRTYVLYGSYTGLTDHFNTIGVIFILFWIICATFLLKALSPIFSISPRSFALTYAGLMVATVLPSMGFGGYFIPLIAGVFYYATPENNWSDIIWPHIPQWVVPHDRELIRQLFEGIDSVEPIPWSVWVEPLCWWSIFMFSFFLVSFGLIALVHNQWSHRERLVYPLATVPQILTDSLDDRSTGILQKKLLWFGFFIAAIIPTINMIDHVFDLEIISGFNIPSGQISIESLGLNYQTNLDLLVLGLSYLVNLNILGSVWLFHLVIGAEASFLNFLGITTSLPAQPHSPANILLGHQQIGSLICIVIISVWKSRDFIKDQWSIISGNQTNKANIVSPRLALLLAIAGMIYMTGFLYASGLAIGWSIIFFLIAIIVFFGIARLLAQTGIGRLRAPMSIPPILTNTVGSTAIGSQGITALGLSMVWTADVQLFLMGTLAHAFRICEPKKLRIKGRHLLWFTSVAMIIGLTTTLVSYIYLGYRHGLIHGYSWYFVISPQYHWSWVASTITNPNPAEPLAWFFIAIGVLLSGVLSLASYQWAGWPIHPIGLAIALTNTVSIDWFGIFLAWLIKLIVLRYGGISLYRKTLPIFVGLIFGTCVGIGGSAVVYAFYFF